ncbi:MAG: XisI protein [Cyanophyceae cyanobacterium]
MDKLAFYRSCVQTLLESHGGSALDDNGVEMALCFDSVRDRYLLMRVGWDGLNRVYHSVLHFDIKGGKVWLQQNTTDIDVGVELMELGVAKEDIVLGLHPPYKRFYAGYGMT